MMQAAIAGFALRRQANEPSVEELAAANVAAEQRQQRDVVAEWRVPTKARLHVIEFEHGTTSGKRVLWIDGREEFRRDWMFKLVGDDTFVLDGVRCLIRVNPASGMRFTYALYVDGKPFEQYRERQARALKTWQYTEPDKEVPYRIVLEKDTLNIFLDGVMREEEGEFVEEGGTDTEFVHDSHVFRVSARSGDNARDGLMYRAYVDDTEIDECVEK